MDFGRPNAEIGRKMVNGQLLFLVLTSTALCEDVMTVGLCMHGLLNTLTVVACEFYIARVQIKGCIYYVGRWSKHFKPITSLLHH